MTGFTSIKHESPTITGHTVYYSDAEVIDGKLCIHCVNCGKVIELDVTNEVLGDGFAECDCGCHMDYWEGKLGGYNF